MPSPWGLNSRAARRPNASRDALGKVVGSLSGADCRRSSLMPTPSGLSPYRHHKTAAETMEDFPAPFGPSTRMSPLVGNSIAASPYERKFCTRMLSIITTLPLRVGRFPFGKASLFGSRSRCHLMTRTLSTLQVVTPFLRVVSRRFPQLAGLPQWVAGTLVATIERRR
jgi:hypothetical protein